MTLAKELWLSSVWRSARHLVSSVPLEGLKRWPTLGWEVWFTCALMLNFVHLCCLMPLALGPGQFLYLHWPLQHDSVKLARREFQNFLFVFSGKQGLADSFQIHPWACWRMAPELRIDSTFSKACTIFFSKVEKLATEPVGGQHSLKHCLALYLSVGYILASGGSTLEPKTFLHWFWLLSDPQLLWTCSCC